MATLSARHVVGTSRAPGDFRGEAYHNGSAVNSRAPTDGATRHKAMMKFIEDASNARWKIKQVSIWIIMRKGRYECV